MSTTTEILPLVNSPFCRELRSKRYYFQTSMPTEEGQFLDGSNRCWCNKTMQVVGPDGEMVFPGECAPGRDCYKSVFALEESRAETDTGRIAVVE